MKAEHTGGHGPEIILSLNGTKLVLHQAPEEHKIWKYGTIREGSLDLTIEEAETLAAELLNAAQEARRFNQLLEQENERRHS